MKMIKVAGLFSLLVCPAISSPTAQTIYNANDNGVTPPKVVRHVSPPYTDSARNARKEGVVVLAMIVFPDGRAHNVTVVRSLDPGLDHQAIEAVRQQWRFSPGKRNGRPVAVRCFVSIDFRLR
jgi:TonB family protein